MEKKGTPSGGEKRLAKFLQKAIAKRKQTLINLMLTKDEIKFKRHELEQLTLTEIEELVKRLK